MVCKLESGQAVLDIGSFHGEYALATRKVNMDVPIFAFEPNPENASVLRTNVADENIRIEEIAGAETDGEVTFSLNAATSRISDMKMPSDSTALIRVPSICIDSWTKANGISPGLIKIDTEGFEGGILRGSKLVLKKHQPVILCEVLSDDAGKEVMKALPATYLFFYIDEDKGIEPRKIITRRKWRNRNWLLMPQVKTHWITDLAI
jgi:FkbM family methyltransferase